MGQRHQLFVIAKVKNRYRTLCAVHHQWLYGHTALRRCLGTLRILQDPTNRVPIQQELIAATNHDDDFWACSGRHDYRHKNAHVPFPFIATCLILGASYSPDGYSHRVLIEPFFMAYNGGDNNNGITVFDITDPSHVHYCFIDFCGMESTREVPLMTPLSARTYLEAYYVLSDPENSRDLVPLVEAFEEWHLISTATLEDAWPGEGWKAHDEEIQEHQQCDEKRLVNQESAEPQIVPGEACVEAVGDPIAMYDIAMDLLLKELIEQPVYNAMWVVEGELLPDFLPRLKTKLYNQSTQLKPSPALVTLLSRALENDREVDLSPFTTLSATDLSSLVSKLRSDGKMALLNLSNRPDITEEELHIILGPDLDLQALCLLEMPQISSQSLNNYASHCEVYCSDILRLPLITDPYKKHESTPVPTMSINNTMTQIHWLGMSCTDSMNEKYRLDDGMIAWDTLKPAARGSNPYRGFEGLLKYTSCDIDIAFPAGKLVQSFLHLLQWIASADMTLSFLDAWSNGVACSLAASPPRGFPGTGHGVGPLSPKLWTERGGHDESRKNAGPTALEPGKWALVMFSEAFDMSNQEGLDKMFENKYPTLKPSATATEPTEPSTKAGADLNALSLSDNPISTGSLDAGAQTNVDPLLFGGVGKLDSPDDKIKREQSRLIMTPPSFRPRKEVKYALVTPVAGSETDVIAADVPAYLQELMGDQSEDLVDLWDDEFASLQTVRFCGEHGDFDKLLQKFYPGKTCTELIDRTVAEESSSDSTSLSSGPKEPLDST